MELDGVQTLRSATGRLREILWRSAGVVPHRLRLAGDGRTVLLERAAELEAPGGRRPRVGSRGTSAAVAPALRWTPVDVWDRPGAHTLRAALERCMPPADVVIVRDLLRGFDYR